MDRTPRDLSGDPRHHRAEQRRARVRDFLAAHPRPGGTALAGLADELGISLRHAERLVAETRSDAGG
ncbi:hypothetical protein [Streptomyces sp. MJP52]|uniref:hypothetical protein n=1 Tax=Streptomyces sp. MJP52 TaxID=2940555 RepID=UPI0024748E36|nr:hypothetical protein [Streptomyces sp. MJP52]